MKQLGWQRRMVVAGLLGMALCSSLSALAEMKSGVDKTGTAGQAVVLPTDGLTLSAALGQALVNNPDLRLSIHAIEQALAFVDLARSSRRPQVHALLGITATRDPQRVLPPERDGDPGAYARGIVDGSLIVQFPLYTAGRLRGEEEASQHRKQAVEAKLTRVRRELVTAVVRVFYQILAQRQVLTSLEFSRQTLQQHLARVNRLIAAGKGTNVDRLRLQVRIATLDERLVQERNVLEIGRRALANLMGGTKLPPRLVGKIAQTIPAQLERDEDAALALALQQRADIRSARAELRAARKRLQVARAGYRPTVNLQASLSPRYAPDPDWRGSGADHGDVMAFAGVVMDVPIFEGGRIKARIRQRQAELDRAVEQLRKVQLAVRYDVQRALLNLTAAEQRERTMATVVSQAKESLRLEQVKQREGNGTITDVLDAQTAELDAETLLIRANADQAVSIQAVRAALGMDFPGLAKTPTPQGVSKTKKKSAAEKTAN